MNSASVVDKVTKFCNLLAQLIAHFNKTEIEKIWDFPGEFIIRGVFKD